ncbi:MULTISPECIES: hypothetical protein [Brucella]|jgi:hypothetical protein|uniref:Lipoprotein n=2 Tax=Brucella TaxID=234 RepID=A0A1A9FNF2_9HYPH|nr:MULTISPECIES: hypothetical protein [Brucella]EMG53006.1 hypothetical protein WYI_14386 [Ochrobactrum sp. CDB2]MBK0022124.1 hypothetical protein [Ochrobactrum sp. S45]MBK0044138.1 hypothetical protein [Ochrobactrum sp. S46]MBO1025954.1 hypothetical protein [Ochrobactrum sp. SD129]MQP42139.1 hypothetical protein [Ochrobactrum sp. MYb237]
MKIEGRVLVLMTAVAGLALSGCVSSPTYGTDKTASAQLLDDVSNMASFGQGKKKDRIDYKPRPDLVRPAQGEKGALPAPQESVASAGDPSWPESPEQRRKRLRDEITANRDNPNFVSPVEQDVAVANNLRASLPSGNSRREDYESRTPTFDPARVAELKKQREAQTQGSSTTRRYLSEPPLAYRQPASTAAVGEMGQDESQKERERKKAAGGGGKSWRDLLPWN